MSAKNVVINYRRCVVGAILPCGLSQDEIDANLRDVARRTFEDGARNVRVAAYNSTVRPERNAVHLIAELTFAPYGDFDKTDRVYSLDDYRATIKRYDIDDPMPEDFEECER